MHLQMVIKTNYTDHKVDQAMQPITDIIIALKGKVCAHEIWPVKIKSLSKPILQHL